MEELERAYIVHLDGMGCGTDSNDILICRPSELDANLDVMAWEHHDQWGEPDEDDDGCDPECQSSASATEYTPENYRDLDGDRSGGGSFLDDKGVKEVWKALGYTRPKFEGDSAFDAWEYIKRWNIPVCQAGASWQMVENWMRQIRACEDVIRVLGGLSKPTVDALEGGLCLLNSQLLGAANMATNERNILVANLQKVVARLKAL